MSACVGGAGGNYQIVFLCYLFSSLFQKGKRKEKQTAVSIVLDSIVQQSRWKWWFLCWVVLTVVVVVVVCFCSFFWLGWLLDYTTDTHADVSYYLVDAVITPTWKPFLSFLSRFSLLRGPQSNKWWVFFSNPQEFLVEQRIEIVCLGHFEIASNWRVTLALWM